MADTDTLIVWKTKISDNYYILMNSLAACDLVMIGHMCDSDQQQWI